MRPDERLRTLEPTCLAITEAAVSVAIFSKTYPGGVTYYITHGLPSGDRVEVHDKWWKKNPEVWVGYEVHIEDADSIVRRTWPITKKRSEVVAAVREALASMETA